MDESPERADGRREDRTAVRRAEGALLRVAQALAVVGGAVLVALAAITVYSILGRALPSWPGLAWWRPVRGDFELVEMGTAVAIFAFLPYAQIARSNVLVDFFTSGISQRAKSALAIPANLLFTVIAGLFTWRMVVATEDLMTSSYTQTTMLLRVPIWWGYLPATAFMAFLTLVCAFTVWRALDEALHDGEPAVTPS